MRRSGEGSTRNILFATQTSLQLGDKIKVEARKRRRDVAEGAF